MEVNMDFEPKEVIIEKWIAALRSGNYVQGTGALNCNDNFCCLGVLCEVAKLPKERGATFLYSYRGYENDVDGGMIGSVPYDLARHLGMAMDGKFLNLITMDEQFWYSLTQCNDGSPLSGESNLNFSQIAELIENNKPNIFYKYTQPK
jgi:hypothetical protein